MVQNILLLRTIVYIYRIASHNVRDFHVDWSSSGTHILVDDLHDQERSACRDRPHVHPRNSKRKLQIRNIIDVKLPGPLNADNPTARPLCVSVSQRSTKMGGEDSFTQLRASIPQRSAGPVGQQIHSIYKTRLGQFNSRGQYEAGSLHAYVRHQYNRRCNVHHSVAGSTRGELQGPST